MESRFHQPRFHQLILKTKDMFDKIVDEHVYVRQENNDVKNGLKYT